MKKTDSERILMLENAIHGNGAKGMTDQINDISKDMKEVKESLLGLQKRQERFVGIAVGVTFLLSTVLSFLFNK